MRNYLAIFLLYCIVLQANALTLKGKVVDEQLFPIAYVNIGIEFTSIGTVSNQNGEFTIFIDPSYQNQFIKFSCIGYETLVLSIFEINKNPQIVLKKKVIQLAEFNFQDTQFLQEEEHGYFRQETLMKVNFAISNLKNQNLGSGIGKKFKLKHEKNVLKQVCFSIAYNNFDTAQFQLHVYEIDKNGFPGNEVLNDKVIVTLNNRQRGLITVDLQHQLIIIPKKCIVALEWISSSLRGNVVSMPLAMPSFETHYYKFGAQNRWKKYKSMSNAIKIKTTAIN